MIKKTLYFGNPAYLSLRDSQLIIKFPEIVKPDNIAEAIKKESIVSRPIEDIGIMVLDNKQITVTSGVLEALLENNSAVITYLLSKGYITVLKKLLIRSQKVTY